MELAHTSYVQARLALVTAFFMAASASAQNVDAPPEMNYERLMRMELRVIREDIVDYPYRVIANIEADAKQATRFSKRPTNSKLAEELWDQASTLGADAVLNATFSDLETTGWFYARRRAYGQAVKFLTPEEARTRKRNGISAP